MSDSLSRSRWWATPCPAQPAVLIRSLKRFIISASWEMSSMSATSDTQRRSVFFRWEEFCVPPQDVVPGYFLWMMAGESAVSWGMDSAVGLCFAGTVRQSITRALADRGHTRQQEVPYRVILSMKRQLFVLAGNRPHRRL